MAKQTRKKKDPLIKRSSLINLKVNGEELDEIKTKAALFTMGNLSSWLRLSAMNYKPERKK
jgi:hypothetical protein